MGDSASRGQHAAEDGAFQAPGTRLPLKSRTAPSPSLSLHSCKLQNGNNNSLKGWGDDSVGLAVSYPFLFYFPAWLLIANLEPITSLLHLSEKFLQVLLLLDNFLW